MGSRREEERNEKIIRGLMKLPPNRRCINCNSLGPQYVCTNFWTFICMTCSGIHREFTHRVKSVSMSKFTSDEVEALQNGGNQRAREMYLKGWDPSQRLPDNSNVDKVRDFIKSVYIDKRYAGGKSHDKPPRDLQRLRSHEDETRRASSYHSYSQSPPYDYQYEERRYGKQSGVLSRKPGSDRGLYLGKMSSFICSPNRLSERMFEDRFANEGSVSRVSDYSASSGGDLVIADSPNFVKDISHSSPPQTSRNVFGQDVHHQRTEESSFKRDAERPPHPQRSASLGSIGSFDSNSVSVKSFNSSSVADVASDHEQATGTLQDQLSTTKEISGSVSCNSLDHIKAPVGPEAVASVGSSIDLFQLPAKSPASPVSFFEVSQLDPALSTNACHSSQNFLATSLDLFSETAHQQSVNSLDQCPVEQPFPKNEGWATFDTVPTTSAPENGNLTSSVVASSAYSSAKLEQASTLNGPMQWSPFQNTFQGSASGSSLWRNGPPNTQPHDSAIAPMWNAFDDSIKHFPSEGATQSSTTQASYMLSSADWCSGLNASEDHGRGGTQNVPPCGQGELSGQHGQPDILLQPSYTTLNPVMEPTQPHASNHKSTNPFDLPYDSELETGNTFLDMSSLQAVLPDTPLPSTFLGGVTEPWFPQEPVPSVIPNAPQGGLAYMAGQVPSNQLASVQTQGPVASVGGNPFA